MSQRNSGHELTVDGQDFADCMRMLDRTSKRSAASEMTLTYTRGELVAEISGAAVAVSAVGAWPGTVTINRSATGLLSRLGAGKTVLTVTPGERLKVGSTSFPCRLAPRPTVYIDLPLDPTLLQLLRLREAHADEDLLAAGLLEKVEGAEKKLTEMIELAALQLKEVGDFRDAIADIVRGRVYG